MSTINIHQYHTSITVNYTLDTFTISQFIITFHIPVEYTAQTSEESPPFLEYTRE